MTLEDPLHGPRRVIGPDGGACVETGAPAAAADAELGDPVVLLEADADDHAQATARAAPVIAVAFRSFADGRGFSLAQRLRAAGYAGRLRAAGHLLPDQFGYAKACGFDEVAVPEPLFARQGEAAWRAAAAAPVPPAQRRRAAARA